MSEFTKGPLIEKGTVANCEIGGFIAIGREDSPSTAYVAYRNDANLYRAAPDMYAALEDFVEMADAEGWASNPDAIRARTALAKARGE